MTSVVTVAFQGETAAYSEEAALKYFGNASLVPCRTVADVFDAVTSEAAVYGVVPVENSTAGSINETYDLLLKYELWIRGEIIIPIEHCLMALPGQQLSDIRQVYSHPQALAQCYHYLQNLGVQTLATHDTAGSARMIRERQLRGVGAVASKRAAELYGLEVLASSIQDSKTNYTRFYVIGKEPSQKGAQNKTVLVFTTVHRPGALFWSLGAFVCRGINLLKIESRPIMDKPWEYRFYVDIEGHVDDPECREALDELKTKTTFMRVLGSFPCALG